jgi:hypothetical protein
MLGICLFSDVSHSGRYTELMGTMRQRLLYFGSGSVCEATVREASRWQQQGRSGTDGRIGACRCVCVRTSRAQVTDGCSAAG